MQNQPNIILYKNTDRNKLRRRKTFQAESNREMSKIESFQNESEIINKNFKDQKNISESQNTKQQNDVETMRSLQQSLVESLVIMKNICSSNIQSNEIIKNFGKVVELVKEFQLKFKGQLTRIQEQSFDMKDVLNTRKQSLQPSSNLVHNLQALVLHKENIITKKNVEIKNLKNRNFLIKINKKFSNKKFEKQIQSNTSFDRNYRNSNLLSSDVLEKDLLFKKNSLARSDVQQIMKSTLYRKTTYDPAKQKVMKYAELIELKVKEKLQIYKKLREEKQQNIDSKQQDKKIAKLKQYFQSIQRKNIQNIVKIKKMLIKKLFHSNEQQNNLRSSWLRFKAFQKLEKILQNKFFSLEEFSKTQENIEKRIGKKDLNLKTLSFQSQNNSLDSKEDNYNLNNKDLVIEKNYTLNFYKVKQIRNQNSFEDKKFNIINFDKRDESSLLKLESIQFNLMKRINDIDKKQLKQHYLELQNKSKVGADKSSTLKTSSERNSSEPHSNIFKFKNN